MRSSKPCRQIGVDSRRKAFLLRNTLCYVIATGILGGCDFSVVNPGPVEDQYLNPVGTHPALVVGMERALYEALNELAWTGSVIALELKPSGGYIAQGVTPAEEDGVLLPSEQNSGWSLAHRARWVAEDGIRRMEEALGESEATNSSLVGKAYLWAGMSNRLLGENMCVAIIDRGAATDHKTHFERADAQLSQAIATLERTGNTQLAMSAKAGRASVRAALGRWSEAEADASAIARDHVLQLAGSIETTSLWNNFAYANFAAPFRSVTTWNTFFEDYYLESKDPRVAWGTDPRFPFGDGRGNPWYFELKYGPSNMEAAYTLTSGHEAQLIIAEAKLRSGSRDEALKVINQRRTELGLPEMTASSDEEAWAILKLERFIELWLEARALGDHRRYAAESIPGGLPALFDMTGRDLCFPISEAEQASNPNLR